MFTKLTKWLSIVALLLGAFLTSSVSYRICLEMVVCLSALVVMVQAFRIGKYFWGIGFGAIAVLSKKDEKQSHCWKLKACARCFECLSCFDLV